MCCFQGDPGPPGPSGKSGPAGLQGFRGGRGTPGAMVHKVPSITDVFNSLLKSDSLKMCSWQLDYKCKKQKIKAE